MTSQVSFEEFVRSLGFKSYPFNSFTAENEKDRQERLFVSTGLYSPLYEAFESGQTMILSGDRGTGKTSITYDFLRRANNSHLICQIDDFGNLPKGYSESELYRFILECLVNAYFRSLPSLRKARSSLDENERILLTYYFIHFAADATRGTAKRVASSIQTGAVKSALISVYNWIRAALNVGTNVGVSIISEVVSRSVGVQSVGAAVADYFPEISAGVESSMPRAEDSLEALRRFVTIAKKSGFSRIVVILDKIDEDARLENAAEEIADFILPLLTSNKLLLDSGVQIVVSLWVVPLNFIRDRVRTQKVFSPEVRWELADLRRAYDRRVSVYSEGAATGFDGIFDDEVSDAKKIELLELSNKNPRDLWHLFDKIFRAQFGIDARATKIGVAALDQGMADFVRQFNFYEYYPRKANARANSMDVYAYIRHLQRLEDRVFTRNQLNERAGTGSSTQNYTIGMESLGLIEKDTSDRGEIKYRIRDPKVWFAISKGVEISRG